MSSIEDGMTWVRRAATTILNELGVVGTPTFKLGRPFSKLHLMLLLDGRSTPVKIELERSDIMGCPTDKHIQDQITSSIRHALRSY